MRLLPKLVLFCVLVLAACAPDDPAKEIKVTKDNLLPDTDAKPMPAVTAPVNTDTLVVKTKAAVFYQPDSLQVEARMKEIGEDDFRAGMDDYLFYMSESWQYLERQGLPLLDAKGKKFIQFIPADGKVQLVRLDTVPELWGVYLFDGVKAPYKADMTSMEEEYKAYYK